MSGKLFSLALVVLVAAGAAPAKAGDVLDRIVATVNGQVILQSDWEDAERYEAFMAGHVPDRASIVEGKATLDRLIDQELLREQMRASDFQHASAAEVEQRVEEIRKLYPGTADIEQWRNMLARYGVHEPELRKRIGLQLDLIRLVDARLRPGVSIDAGSVESYYDQELLPQLRQAGEAAKPLAEVLPKIKELLTQQKMNELLTAWLQNLRSGSEIRTEIPASDAGDTVR